MQMNNVKEFESFLILKGLQPITVMGHINGVRRVLTKIGTPYPTKEQSEQFIAFMYTSNYSYYHKVNSAKSLEYWLEFIGQPIRFNRQKRPKTLLKDTFSESEINRLLFVCKNIREKAIISFLAYSGLRPKELCRVIMSDINISSRILYVNQGKGFKDGFVQLAPGCIDILMKYLTFYSRNNDDLVFQKLSGKSYDQQALRKLIKTVAKRANLTKRIYPYLLRHSFATNMIKRGAHLLYVKEQLRHSWIDTTMRYVHSLVNLENTDRFLPQYI